MAVRAKIETQTKIARHGNSSGLTLPREVMDALDLNRGDEVVLVADRKNKTLTVRKADDAYNRTVDAARIGADRYRNTLAALAK